MRADGRSPALDAERQRGVRCRIGGRCRQRRARAEPGGKQQQCESRNFQDRRCHNRGAFRGCHAGLIPALTLLLRRLRLPGSPPDYALRIAAKCACIARLAATVALSDSTAPVVGIESRRAFSPAGTAQSFLAQHQPDVARPFIVLDGPTRPPSSAASAPFTWLSACEPGRHAGTCKPELGVSGAAERGPSGVNRRPPPSGCTALRQGQLAKGRCAARRRDWRGPQVRRQVRAPSAALKNRRPPSPAPAPPAAESRYR